MTPLEACKEILTKSSIDQWINEYISSRSINSSIGSIHSIMLLKKYQLEISYDSLDITTTENQQEENLDL